MFPSLLSRRLKQYSMFIHLLYQMHIPWPVLSTKTDKLTTQIYFEVNVLVYSPYDNFLYFLYFLKLLMCQKFKNEIPHHHFHWLSVKLM